MTPIRSQCSPLKREHLSVLVAPDDPESTARRGRRGEKGRPCPQTVGVPLPGWKAAQRLRASQRHPAWGRDRREKMVASADAEKAPAASSPQRHSLPERRSPRTRWLMTVGTWASVLPEARQTRVGVLSAPGRSSPCFSQHLGHPAPWPPGHVAPGLLATQLLASWPRLSGSCLSLLPLLLSVSWVRVSPREHRQSLCP